MGKTLERLKKELEAAERAGNQRLVASLEDEITRLEDKLARRAMASKGKDQHQSGRMTAIQNDDGGLFGFFSKPR